MNNEDKKIEALIKLTVERSNTDRSLLYRHVAFMLLRQHTSAPSGNQNLLKDLFHALSSHVEVECRKELAIDVAQNEHLPRFLALTLAKDVIDVATPILQNVNFSEEDFLDIIAHTGRQHHVILTERGDLSQSIWQAISAHKTEESYANTSSDSPSGVLVSHSFRQPGTPAPRTVGSASLFVTDSPDPVKTDKHQEHEPVFSDENPPKYSFSRPKNRPAAEIYFDKTAQVTQEDFLIKWEIDSKGHILNIDENCEAYFGMPADQLIGQYFWQFFDSASMQNSSAGINHLIDHHLPLREIHIALKNGHGDMIATIITGHGQFEWGSGRFKGYKGILVNANEPPRQLSPRYQAAKTKTPPSSDENMLAHYLSRDASQPIEDMLTTLKRLARSARKTNDLSMIADISSLLSDCFHLRDIVQDAERISRMFGSGVEDGRENFDVFKILNPCIEDDSLRHGGNENGLNRFRLVSALSYREICFSRSILNQTLIRMLELSRELAGRHDHIDIRLSDGADGRMCLSIELPAIDQGRIDAEYLRSPDTEIALASLRAAKKSARDISQNIMNAKLGLAALINPIEALGGQLDINLSQQKNSALVLHLPYAQ